MAPALLLYQWQLSELKGLGWAVTMAFAVCCALRLARFNTKLDNTDLPAWTSRFFVGVPAPAGAGLALIPVMATFELGTGYVDHPIFVGAVELVVALLMVSRFPTYSIKRIRIPHHHVMAALLVFGLLAATLVSIPWITLLGVGAVYIGSMPLAVVAHRRLSSAQQPVTGGAEADVSRDTPVE